MYDRLQMYAHLPENARIDLPPPDLANTRTRLDLMWHEGALGIRDRTRADGSFTFHSIEDPDAAPPLKLMTRDFAADPPPVAQAQVRFRCAHMIHSNSIATNASGAGDRSHRAPGHPGSPPGGSAQRRQHRPGGDHPGSATSHAPPLLGVWIDASRRDIAHLFAERQWLERALARGWIVELGQRGGAAGPGPAGPVPVPAPRIPWLPSFDEHGAAIPLVSTIASFSQPGPEANLALITAAFRVLDAAGIDRASWFEWGAGYGNLSAAMARRLGDDGTATEAHPLAAELLEENGRQHFRNVRALRHSAEASDNPGAGVEIGIIDPPRPGFGRLLETLTAGGGQRVRPPGGGPGRTNRPGGRLDRSDRPRGRLDRTNRPDRVLAFHCHAEGLANDSALLAAAGARVAAWTSVDLFPGSPHREVIALWNLT